MPLWDTDRKTFTAHGPHHAKSTLPLIPRASHSPFAQTFTEPSSGLHKYIYATKKDHNLIQSDLFYSKLHDVILKNNMLQLKLPKPRPFTAQIHS